MTKAQKGFSFAQNFVLDDLENIGKNEILTYMAIARFAKVETNQAVLKQDTIARIARLHRTTVNESVKKLHDLGIITVEHQVKKGGGTAASRYTLNNDGPIVLDASDEFADDSTPEDVFQESPSQTTDAPTVYLTGTARCTAQVHHNNNNTFNNKNSILSKDSIKSDSVAPPRQGTLFQIPAKKDPLLALPFLEKKSLEMYLKGKKGRERATLKLRLAELGKCSWEELTDTDFVYYYVDQHNMVMDKPLVVSGTPGVDANKLKAFRTTYNISMPELYSIIPKLFLTYKTEPECDGCLNFGTLSNAHFIAGPLVERIRKKEESTFTVKANDLHITEEQRRNAPEVF